MRRGICTIAQSYAAKSEIAEINAVAPRSPMHMKRAPKQFANLGFHLLETKSLCLRPQFTP